MTQLMQENEGESWDDPDLGPQPPLPPAAVMSVVDHMKLPAGTPESEQQEEDLFRFLSSVGMVGYEATAHGADPHLAMGVALVERGLSEEEAQQWLDFSRGTELAACKPGVLPDCYAPVPTRSRGGPSTTRS